MEIGKVLISLQEALLTHVTPNLRSVYLDHKEKNINLFFYYDNPPTEMERELANSATALFIANLPSSQYKTNCQILTLKYPLLIPDNGFCMYLRYE